MIDKWRIVQPTSAIVTVMSICTNLKVMAASFRASSDFEVALECGLLFASTLSCTRLQTQATEIHSLYEYNFDAHVA